MSGAQDAIQADGVDSSALYVSLSDFPYAQPQKVRDHVFVTPAPFPTCP
jgi:hypothetical protein